MKILIKNVREIWQNCHQATFEFAKNVPERDWFLKPFAPRFKSFSWEFACLTRTRMCYLKALKTDRENRLRGKNNQALNPSFILPI